MKCPHCNQEHPDEFQFCPILGKKIYLLKACPNTSCPDYGKDILPLDSLFCPTCGIKLDAIQIFNVDSVSFQMIKVESGTFDMGDDAYDNCQKHRVVITNDYFISKTPVTQELWEKIMGNNPSHFNGKYNPVDSVSWNACLQFIIKLNTILKQKFRFPTEAEWEFAARGGIKSKNYSYAGSNHLDEVAWYVENNIFCKGSNWVIPNDGTQPVAQKLPNELGIYDMSGNVWEWCFDWYTSDYYRQSSVNNPKGPRFGTERVIRGGCWINDAEGCLLGFRNYFKPDASDNGVGFRLALSC